MQLYRVVKCSNIYRCICIQVQGKSWCEIPPTPVMATFFKKAFSFIFPCTWTFGQWLIRPLLLFCFALSLISPMVSVDVKHHVHLLSFVLSLWSTFNHSHMTTWCTISCYRKPCCVMSLFSNWARTVGFETYFILIWLWSDTSHQQPVKIVYHIINRQSCSA